jgi:hypothetical protein
MRVAEQLRELRLLQSKSILFLTPHLTWMHRAHVIDRLAHEGQTSQ